MLSLISVFVLRQVPLDQLDDLAQKRDVAGLSRFLADTSGVSPFKILKTGGGYAAGSKGWHAKSLEPKDGSTKYVVFSTPILAEDAGELLFRVNKDQKLEFVPERDSLGMQLDSHSFDVSFDLPNHKVSVTDKMQATWTTAPRPHFVFRLSPTFQISQITGASGQPIPFSQAGGVVAVSSGPNDKVFNIVYAGTVEKPGFARVIGPDEATLSGSMWYPMIARHPATYDIAIHSPANWLAVAQGNEVSDTVAGAERITKYKMDLPVVWISATTGPYRQVTTVIDGREYSTVSAKATDEAMRTQNENNAEVVEFYSKTFGKYPFKRWTTVDSTQFRQGVGALEAYSFATYPAGGVPFFDTHEPAHTWWGGIINNDYLASIWNESFADYSQVLFKRDQPIGNLEERQRAYVPQVGYSPAFDAAPLAHSGQDIGPPATALGYSKGAYVLQVLEDELGTPTFLRSMREWVHSNPVAHIGSWEDFEAVVDRVSGHDYSWFFDEWVRKSGMPDCSLGEGTWADGKFSGRVSFTGDPYRLDTDVLIEMPDGTRSYSRASIDPAKDGKFEVSCPTRPSLVALDPWGIIARHDMPEPPETALKGQSRDRFYIDPQNPGYMKAMVSGTALASLPADLDGVFLIGSPESLPALAPLCDKVGFHVAGQKLTYKGTTIDLSTSGAVALVDLPGGKHCLIGLGVCNKRPDFGKARLAVFDEKGRVLRAETDPIETGSLVFRLP